ncbi:hypothetical protein FACS1894137_09390 [Spirochaetia bacterium]|nr:hypothetical protein FACS1894137_09390 [Spirochaetia bacterium]
MYFDSQEYKINNHAVERTGYVGSPEVLHSGFNTKDFAPRGGVLNPSARMKKCFNTLAVGLAVLLTFAACVQTDKSVSKSDAVVQTIEVDSLSFDEAQGKVWVLNELVSEDGNTVLNRQKLEADGMGDVFTLVVDEGQISGKAAPNRYRSPYTLGPDQEISISPIAGTLMMSIVEPEGIQEREYFNYLEQVNQWFLTGDVLELHSETPDGDPVVLVFTTKEDAKQ